MVDLQGQHKKIEPELNQAISEVIESGKFINGPQVVGFEENLKNYLGCKHVVSCGNGTDALQIALMSLELNPGDEIITTTFSFIATAEVIALLGLKPVFADINPKTFNIDPKSVKEKITERTKAIIPVHLFGQCAPMDEILEIAEEYDLFVIEDAAQSLGTEFEFQDGERKKAGTMGHIGTTSFFPSKNLGCMGDGGAIFTNDNDLADKISMIKNHGSKQKYFHEIVGVNSRLDTIQAAVLNVKLKTLDQNLNNRKRVAELYKKSLKDINWITTPFENQPELHTYNQFSILISGIEREKLIEYLKSNGIPSMVYYPIPLHQQAVFKDSFAGSSLEISEEIKTKILSLPIDPEYDSETIDFIIQKLKVYK